ncbi:oxygenase MpaB family protein [Nocardioides currus]|uniref:DUF2236 domain-containing protein n=1 Tax=Nocardioides currus TaxID=2133958 RepID=A0A2R7YYR2_9ACTN|nr:oxygenase MpaB family protein [Nocardioides currus]PUA81019.1 DUF2236 domain-containing protein [Nocardioides currus]
MATVRARLGQELFRRVAGPDGPKHRERIHGTPGPRWFDADSEIVRVHGDASMFVGGIRAILLQTMHPAAMQAVADHSGYRGDMWGRLARTSHFLAVTTFGTAEHAEQAIRAVRSIHERVVGTMPDGTPYAAGDPHLLAWVHAAEVDSFLLAHQTYGARPLDDAGCDAYVAQAGLVASKLGVVDPPTTVAELRDVLEAFRPELRATDETRAAVRFLVLHPDLPMAARPAYGVLIAAGVALMPRWTRRPLRLPWLPVSERTVVRALGTLATGTIRWAMSSGIDEAHELRASASA